MFDRRNARVVNDDRHIKDTHVNDDRHIKDTHAHGTGVVKAFSPYTSMLLRAKEPCHAYGYVHTA